MKPRITLFKAGAKVTNRKYIDENTVSRNMFYYTILNDWIEFLNEASK